MRAPWGSLRSAVMVAAVQLDDPPGDGQAEAGTAVVGGPGGVGPEEPVEDPLGLLGRDARAGVEHLDDHAARERAGRRGGPAASGGAWRSALPRRLATTWCSRSGSPSTSRPGGRRHLHQGVGVVQERLAGHLVEQGAHDEAPAVERAPCRPRAGTGRAAG